MITAKRLLFIFLFLTFTFAQNSISLSNIDYSSEVLERILFIYELVSEHSDDIFLLDDEYPPITISKSSSSSNWPKAGDPIK